MHILHISNSYGGTAVYKNLYTQLDQLGVRQTVYVPLNYKNRDRVGNQMIAFKTPGSQIIYSTVLQPWHRLLYMSKVNTTVKDICAKVDLNTVDAIHASTLCFDGAVAYKLHRKLTIPYITAIRNTDVNDYYKLFVWRRGFFAKVLETAQKVIFISPKYKENFLGGIVAKDIAERVSERVTVVPNGIEPYFLEHRDLAHREMGTPVKLIFISSFKQGKGLIETIKATDILKERGYDVTLWAIGKGLPGRGTDADYINKVEQLATERPWITLEEFKKAPELCEALREADIFVMPSKPETFGLVYVEALSQGIPIVYCKGQGIDGFYADGYVGYPSEAGNETDVADKLELTFKNHRTISENIRQIDLNETFEWSRIAKKYKTFYEEAIQ